MLFRTFCIDLGATTVSDGLAACQACCWDSMQSHSAALQVHDQSLLHTKVPQASALHALPFLSCRTSVISMSLKTGIVGLPNVGKVGDSSSSQACMQRSLSCVSPVDALPLAYLDD